MYIVFYSDRRICEDGFATRLCAHGLVQDVRHGTAVDCIRKGWARNAMDNEIWDYLDQRQQLLAISKMYNDAANKEV